MSFRRFMTTVVCGVVLIFSLTTTSFQIWREYSAETQSRAQYQKVIFDLFQNSMREPLIQGSFIEARARADKLSHQPNIACVGVVAENKTLSDCGTDAVHRRHSAMISAPLSFGASGSPTLAQLTLVFDDSDLFRQLIVRSAEAIAANLLLGFLIFLLFNWAFKTLERELELVVDAAENSSDTGVSYDRLRIREFSYLAERIRIIFGRIKEDAEVRSIAELAKDLAHDICSPLAVLSIATEDLPDALEVNRSQIRNAVASINDIANSLLLRVPSEVEPRSSSASVRLVESHQMMGLLDQVISAKRVEYRKRKTLKIEFRSNPGDYGLFARLDASDFKRVVSNLVNNSVEALGDAEGLISAELENSEDYFFVKIVDDGPGIPSEILHQLLSKNITTKESGHGLGLRSAKQRIETWGGEIAITSSPGSTVVTIRIPKSRPPSWFVPNLEISKGCEVIVLDDDPGIHEIWSTRLKKWLIDESITLRKFTKASELIYWIDRTDAANRLFLIDYELIGQRITGLDLIEKLKIEGDAILVTSRHDEVEVRDRAEFLGVQVLSKMLAGYVPIKFAENIDATFDAVASPRLTNAK